MSQLARQTTWASLQTLTASNLNSEFDNIVNGWNNHDAGTSTWTVINSAAFKKSGTTILSLLQVVYSQNLAADSGTTVTPEDDTIPQSTEGVQMLTASITPVSATSKLTIYASIPVSVTATGTVAAALFQDSTASALYTSFARINANGIGTTIPLLYQMTSGTVSSTTFKVRLGNANPGTIQINSTGAAGRTYGGVMAASMVILETA